VELKERDVTLLRPESMSLHSVTSSTDERVSPWTQSSAVVRALEDAYATQPHTDDFKLRIWGSWDGASQDVSTACHPFEECQRHTTSNHTVSVLASESSCIPSLREASSMEEGSQPDDSGDEGAAVQLDSAPRASYTSKRAQGRGRIAVDDIHQRMSEVGAWEIIAQWRKVLDAADQCESLSKEKARMGAEMFHVTDFLSAQRKELAAKSGFSWNSILKLQELKSSAEIVLMSANHGLVNQVLNPCRALIHALQHFMLSCIS
jgi:hypothetical protein